MKTLISEQELIKVANDRLSNLPGFEDGMQIHSAEMEKHLLKIRGECFLNSDGSPTPKTLNAIAVYDVLAKELGNKYVIS